MRFRRHQALALVFLLGCTPRPADDPGGTDSALDAGDATDAAVEDAAMPLTVRTLITLGSSSTEGAGASSESTRYVNVLADWLGASLVNLGTGGQRVTTVRDVMLPRALDVLDGGMPGPSQIDLVTFLPFTDFASSPPAELASGYDPILTSLETTHAWIVFGVPTIDRAYVCGQGPLRGPDGECYPVELADEYDAKGEAVRMMIAGHARTTVADIPQDLAEHPDWQAPDGHPNDLGHAHIARSFMVEIARRLGVDAGLP